VNLCVYLGSNFGVKKIYRQTAEAVGASVAKRGWTLVYGGANKGMMGAMADAALKHGGKVIGVIPQKLADMGAAKEGLSELHVVKDMHARKAKMAELSNAFLALPGGLGTWEEALEAATWTQIGFHSKRVALLNVAGYYEPLYEQFVRSIEEGFVSVNFLEAIGFGAELEPILDFLSQGDVAVPDTKWFNS
jgi:uncharacterized protein (TIGR00730 family)